LLEALTRGLAFEMAPVRVNVVSPGLVATPMWSGMGEADREKMFSGAAERLPLRRIAALVGHAKGSVTSKYIHTLDTALIMAADTIAGYIQGLLDGIKFKQVVYALDRDSRKAALVRFLSKASGGDAEEVEEDRRLAA
jgi:hypothetical protein